MSLYNESDGHWSACCPAKAVDVAEYERQNKLAHQRLLAKRKAAAATTTTNTESEVRG